MKLKFLILITIFFNIKLFAQTTSPFTSVTGIGELNDLGYSNNVAMGLVLLVIILFLFWIYDRVVGIDNMKLG